LFCFETAKLKNGPKNLGLNCHLSTYLALKGRKEGGYFDPKFSKKEKKNKSTQPLST
jgi:hypothetical protein